MKKKENTPMREIRRKYEETHKEVRKARNMTWGTSLDRELGEEINAFLEKYNIPKVILIREGFRAIKEETERREKERNKE